MTSYLDFMTSHLDNRIEKQFKKLMFYHNKQVWNKVSEYGFVDGRIANKCYKCQQLILERPRTIITQIK